MNVLASRASPCRETCKLALMPVDLVTQRFGGIAIGQTQTVNSRLLKQTLVATVYGFNSFVAKDSMAVLNIITAAIRCIEQSFIPIGVKQCGQRMGKMMIVELDIGVRRQSECLSE